MVEIMRKFTKNEMINGELAIRSLSEKAQKFCSETDPLEVYERLIYPEELENEIVTYEKRYYVRGCLGNFDDMTLDELDELFTDLANDFAEDDEDDEE